MVKVSKYYRLVSGVNTEVCFAGDILAQSSNKKRIEKAYELLVPRIKASAKIIEEPWLIKSQKPKEFYWLSIFFEKGIDDIGLKEVTEMTTRGQMFLANF